MSLHGKYNKCITKLAHLDEASGLVPVTPRTHAGSGGGPKSTQYDYSDTSSNRFARKAAEYAKRDFDKTMGRWGSVARKGIDRRALEKEIRGAYANKKVPPFVLKELRKIIKEFGNYPGAEEYIKDYVKKQEDTLQQHLYYRRKDIKDKIRTIKKGTRKAKRRARRLGLGVAARTLAGAIPDAAVSYVNTVRTERNVARNEKNRDMANLEKQKVAAKRSEEVSRLAYLGELRDKLKAKVAQIRAERRRAAANESYVPNVQDIMERTRKGYLSGDIVRGTAGQYDKKVRRARLKKNSDPTSFHVEFLHGGKRTKKLKKKRVYQGKVGTKRSALEKGVGRDPEEEAILGENPLLHTNPLTNPRAHAIAREKALDPGRFKRPKHKLPANLARTRMRHQKRDLGKAIGLSPQRGGEHIFNVLPENSEMIKANADRQAAKNNASMMAARKPPVKPTPNIRTGGNDRELHRPPPVINPANLKQGMNRVSQKMESHKDDYDYEPKKGSAIVRGIKKAASKTASATGADELARVPGQVHGRVKHHFIHNFLLR